MIAILTGSVGKEPAYQCRRCKGRGFDPRVGKIPWRRKWQPTPVFLPGKFDGQRSLAGYSPWVAKSRTQLSMRAHMHSDRSDMISYDFDLHFPDY